MRFVVPSCFVLVLLLLAARVPAVAGGEGGPQAPAELAWRGFVLPARRAVLSAGATGVLVEVPAAMGERVRAGEALARVDPRESEIAVRLAQAALEGARIDLHLADAAAKHAAEAAARAEPGYADLQANAESGRATSAELRDAKRILEDARAEAERARLAIDRAKVEVDRRSLEVDAARLRLDRTTVVAPFDGVVAKIHAAVGESVRADESPVVTIVDPDSVLVHVTDVAADALPVGARVAIDAGAGKAAIPGRVVWSAPPGLLGGGHREGRSGWRGVAVDPSAGEPPPLGTTVTVRAAGG